MYMMSALYCTVIALGIPFFLANIKSKWYPEMNHHSKGTPFLLVGAKTDLRDDEKVKARLEASHRLKHRTRFQRPLIL